MLKIMIIEAEGAGIEAALKLVSQTIRPPSVPPHARPMAESQATDSPPQVALPAPAKPEQKAAVSRMVDAQTSVLLIDWAKYPIRSAGRDLGLCALCTKRIEKHESYYDGGFDGRRAHFTCAPRTAKEESNGTAA